MPNEAPVEDDSSAGELGANSRGHSLLKMSLSCFIERDGGGGRGSGFRECFHHVVAVWPAAQPVRLQGASDDLPLVERQSTQISRTGQPGRCSSLKGSWPVRISQ